MPKDLGSCQCIRKMIQRRRQSVPNTPSEWKKDAQYICPDCSRVWHSGYIPGSTTPGWHATNKFAVSSESSKHGVYINGAKVWDTCALGAIELVIHVIEALNASCRIEIYSFGELMHSANTFTEIGVLRSSLNEYL